MSSSGYPTPCPRAICSVRAAEVVSSVLKESPSANVKIVGLDLTDEDYLICTPVVLGFGFGMKAWGE